jgi:signal transduction histidine kinase
VAFDEELRTYLEEIERAASAKALVRHRRVDEGSLRRHFLERLRELESGGRSTSGQGGPTVARERFEEWSPRIARFARFIEALPLQDAPVEESAALAFACSALDRRMGLDNESRGLVDAFELNRIVDDFDRRSTIEPYALENRLIHRAAPSEPAVTALGRAFLRLRGKDAVRWLLTIEVEQSQGSRDPWRASRELLEQASSAGGITAEEDARFPFHRGTLERLERLAVLDSDINDDLGEVYYRVTPPMREVVRHVLDASPWHAAVAALLDDERPVVLQGPGTRASDAAIEQTRLIAHEIRNALIPVRHHIDALLASSGEAHRKRLDASRRGVVRVLEFVDDMISTSELVNEPATTFELGELIREALGWQDGGERVEVELAAEPLRIRSSRSRVLRAVSNLLLNALQAASGGQRVRAQTSRSHGTIEIRVDDGGPGVPEEHRSNVFREGFTTRPGGSGFGLAYVRRVVEETLQGRVWCEASDLGGARFVISIPEGKADR